MIFLASMQRTHFYPLPTMFSFNKNIFKKFSDILSHYKNQFHHLAANMVAKLQCLRV